MFVMLSVRTSSTVRERQAETVTKDVNIAANLKNINCIKANINNKLTKTTNSNYNIAHNSNNLNSSNNNNNISDCAIDKTIKKILPSISVDTTILSPSALTTNQPAQNSNKFILTELNNYRKPPTVQVKCLIFMYMDIAHWYHHLFISIYSHVTCSLFFICFNVHEPQNTEKKTNFLVIR